MIIKGKYDTLSRWSLVNRPGLPLLADKDYAYVPILKNAHTWLTQLFQNKLEWDVKASMKDIESCKKIVVLRNPLDRWISAIATYLHDKEGLLEIDKNTLDILTDAVFFDWHTLPQIRFLEGYDTDSCIFFYMGENSKLFNTNIKKFVGAKYSKDINYDDLILNDGSNKPKHKYYKQQIKSFFTRPESLHFQRKINNAYREDYELIEYITNLKLKSKESYENFNS